MELIYCLFKLPILICNTAILADVVYVMTMLFSWIVSIAPPHKTPFVSTSFLKASTFKEGLNLILYYYCCCYFEHLPKLKSTNNFFLFFFLCQEQVKNKAGFILYLIIFPLCYTESIWIGTSLIWSLILSMHSSFLVLFLVSCFIFNHLILPDINLFFSPPPFLSPS